MDCAQAKSTTHSLTAAATMVTYFIYRGHARRTLGDFLTRMREKGRLIEKEQAQQDAL